MITDKEMMKKDEMEDTDGVDDAGTISYNTDSEIGAETIYPARNIKIDRVQFSIFELKRRYDRGNICLDPDFQRNEVWNTRQKSELIESVVMGIPLPLIYLAETMEGKLVIVDGRQRLTTFFRYLNNEFAISGLKIMKELNSCRFRDLENDEKKRKYAAEIEDFQLVIQIIKYPTPDRVRFDIFDRVNRGGTPLNNQEMRNALYQGPATRMLNELAASDAFKSATGYSISTLHMKDKYIILRALSFYLMNKGCLKKKNGEPVVYRSDIEEFLGLSMEYLNWIEEENRRVLVKFFLGVMNNCYQKLGEDAGRIPTDSGRRRPVSMTLFESLFYFVALLEEDGREISLGIERAAVDEMLEDSVFLNALTYNVDSAVHVQERFETVERKYKEIVNA